MGGKKALLDGLKAANAEKKVAIDSLNNYIAPIFPEDRRLSNLDMNGATWGAIRENNKNATINNGNVKIYRATVGGKINPNDYVAINKDIATEHIQNIKERGDKNINLLEMEVPVSDLIMANDATEFIYHPVNLMSKTTQTGRTNLKGLAGAGTAVLGGSLLTPEDNQAHAGWIDKGGKKVLETWHGTPHEFPPHANNPLGKFELDKIGTGEGAQAYGHGIYQADSKDLGIVYREKLAGDDELFHIGNEPFVKLKGRWLNAFKPGYADKNKDLILGIFEDTKKTPEEIKTYYNELFDAYKNKKDGYSADSEEFDVGYFSYSENQIKDALKILDDSKVEKRKPGALYKSHTDIQPEEMIDWDLPISAQSESIKKAISKFAKVRKDTKLSHIYDHIIGMNSPEDFNKELMDNGIYGIKYDDGLSRGKDGAEKKRNYVIFDADKMNIVEKGNATTKALAATTALGGGLVAAQSQWEQMSPQKRAAALNSGLFKGISEIPQDAANIAHDVTNFGAGVLSTADLAGGMGKFGNLLMGNDESRNASINDFMDEQNQTMSGAFGQVDNALAAAMSKAVPYVAPYAAPVINNLSQQWQDIEANPGAANIYGWLGELNRKANIKPFKK